MESAAKRSRRPCKECISGKCTNRTHCVILDTLPHVKITERNRAADLVKNAHSPAKTKVTGGKGFVAILKNSKQLGCVFQDLEPPKSNSILRKVPETGVSWKFYNGYHSRRRSASKRGSNDVRLRCGVIRGKTNPL